MSSTIQKNIKNLLAKKRLSIAELERRIGLRSAVVNILHGRSKNPSIRVTQAIANELGCTVEELMTEENIHLQSSTMQTNLNNLDLKKTQQQTQIFTWDSQLAMKVMQDLSNYLQEQKLELPIGKIFQCIEEIYKYSYNAPNRQVDKTFIKWIVDRLFNAT